MLDLIVLVEKVKQNPGITEEQLFLWALEEIERTKKKIFGDLLDTRHVYEKNGGFFQSE